MVIHVHSRPRHHYNRRELFAIRNWRVFWGGREITDSVYHLDGRLRRARVYQRDENGHYKVDYANGRILIDVLQGRRLTIRRGADRGKKV